MKGGGFLVMKDDIFLESQLPTIPCVSVGISGQKTMQSTLTKPISLSIMPTLRAMTP